MSVATLPSAGNVPAAQATLSFHQQLPEWGGGYFCFWTPSTPGSTYRTHSGKGFPPWPLHETGPNRRTVFAPSWLPRPWLFPSPTREALFPGSVPSRDLPLSQRGWGVTGMATGPKPLLPPPGSDQDGLADIKTQLGLEVSRPGSRIHASHQLPGRCGPTKDRRVQGSGGQSRKRHLETRGQF